MPTVQCVRGCRGWGWRGVRWGRRPRTQGRAEQAGGASRPPALSCLARPALLSGWPVPSLPVVGGCRMAAPPRSCLGCRWPRWGARCASTTWSWATPASSPARPRTRRALLAPRWRCLYMVSGHLGLWGRGQPEMPGVGGARGRGRPRKGVRWSLGGICSLAVPVPQREAGVRGWPRWLVTFVVCPVQPPGSCCPPQLPLTTRSLHTDHTELCSVP